MGILTKNKAKSEDAPVIVEPLMAEDVLGLSTAEQKAKWEGYDYYQLKILEGEDYSVLPSRGRYGIGVA